MTKTGVQTARAPQPAGPYSQGIVANGLFYTAGFGPQDPTNDLTWLKLLMLKVAGWVTCGFVGEIGEAGALS